MRSCSMLCRWHGPVGPNGSRSLPTLHALNFYNAVGFVAGVVVATQFALGTRMHLDVVP